MKQFTNLILLFCLIALGFACASSTKNKKTSTTASSNNVADVNSVQKQTLKTRWDSLYVQNNQAASSIVPSSNAKAQFSKRDTCVTCPVCPPLYDDSSISSNVGFIPSQIICPPIVCPPCPIRVVCDSNSVSEKAGAKLSKRLPIPPWRPPNPPWRPPTPPWRPPFPPWTPPPPPPWRPPFPPWRPPFPPWRPFNE